MSEQVRRLFEATPEAVREARVFLQTAIAGRVEDRSTNAPVPKAPSGEGGRGLTIVDRLCDRWGVHIVREKKVRVVRT